ncbi:cyclopropane-fatty-acyl-phospholipid synthase [Bacteriovorax sp. BSW11_IV]|uniref:SAM-dependent methyltransferase n=1 Tax=Bacteriovorax sp. BSW11_IV TaxID=1353529 RepID=UPI00038A3F2A|nr:cyclopropane-fatty-acyl-phospholipid synthase family protein [Bacteriovorax sp. BSW11_IV]EQC48553.1 cyclopropane-fatty-acyl-phospholipid synthase [Bacteriovorax sp. BSW11_IV]
MENLKYVDIEKVENKGLARTLVCSLLKRMNKGRLTLTFPEGLIVQIGDGIGLSAEIVIKNEGFFKKCMLSGDIGFGESYSDGDWDTPDLTAVVKWLIFNLDNVALASGSKRKSPMMNLMSLMNRVGHIFNRNSKSGSQANISYHYDMSNDFFKLFLDKTMTYSCGIFQDGEDLYKSQLAKYEQLCKDLDLKEGEHVLEIGCGWGGFAEYAATHYKVKVKGITISKEQYDYAKERIANARLEDLVDIVFCDYRNLEGQFDKIVSIEMIEAVGDEFLPTYFEKASSLLRANGVFVIQAITSPDSRYESFKTGVDWIQKHIFPGSLLPSVGAMNRAIEKTDFHIFSLRDIGLHYATTLRKWRERFEENWGTIAELGYDLELKRKWIYYFCYCEAAFAMRNISNVQVVFIKPNNTEVHQL